MIIQTIRERLLASTMIGGVALAAAVALPAASVLVAPTSATAQDYTTGSILGTVVDEAGNPISGATVVIASTEQGFSRTTTSGANGTFRASLVPLGNYEVRISAAGYPTSVDPNVQVRLGSESSYTFTLAAVSAENSLEDIVVTASRPELDFNQTTTGLVVDVAELVTRVPLGRSVTSVALLAPRVIEGDSAFGSQPSLGGSSVAENAFYVNGLNITNFNNYVGGAPVPFDFYRTVDVKTGGYSAEFGRATGGIINAVTKSGTNDFTFALHGNYAPDSLREDSPNISNASTAAGATPFLALNDQVESESWSIIAEAGGPIIRDRLYAYGLYQWQESETSSVNNTGATRTETTNDIPFWGLKLDAYITDSQRLEFTYFNTEGDYSPELYRTADNSYTGGNIVNVGGENWVARYTGNFTDWLTLSAAYGVNEDQNFTTPLDPDTPYAFDVRTGTGVRVPGSNVSTGTSLLTTEREFYRFDADLTFTWMGDHHVRLGMDNEDTTLRHGTSRTGGASYYYYAGDGDIAPVGSDLLEYYVVTNGLGGAPVQGQNRAFYIQDSWDITEDLNLQFGLRHDQFVLDNLAGQEVIDLKDNWGPRFAFNLDPFGNNVDKFYGSYGRYFIPVASNLSYRGADEFYSVYFTPTAGGSYALNPNGTPVGGLGRPVSAAGALGLDICPASAPGGAAGTRSCDVNGDGSQEPPESKYAYGTKATYEDEFIVGYERQVTDLWSVGAAVTYRRLGNVSEDIAVDYLILQYCEEQGIADCDTIYNGDRQYIIANPGEDLTFLVRDTLPDGSRPVLTFNAAEAGLQKASREYMGLELTFDRAYDGIWSLNGSYVLSESIGNYEGTILSDNGQADAGSTILYDHVGLIDGTYGLLPNHRGHQFKLFGSYTFWDSLTLGANFSLISPRKYGCLGVAPATRDPLAAGYGASSRYCFDDPSTPGYNPSLVQRGSVFESDWVSTLDLSVRYTLPKIGFMPDGITVRADVFNVFNSDAVTDLTEAGTLGNTTNVNPNYRNIVGFQSPRYVRFGFDIQF